MNNKTALVFGATGLIGNHCLHFLLDSSSYSQVKIFVRRKLDLEHPKLEQHVINFDEIENYSSLMSGDDLFCCLGTTRKKAGKEGFYKVDFTYVHEIGKIAATNKVNQFLLVSSIGADAQSMVFYSQVKGKIEAAISELDIKAVHIFRPSVLLGERNETRIGEQIGAKIGSFIKSISGNLLGKYNPIEGKTVAEAMVITAQKSERQGVHIYESNTIEKATK